MKAEHLLPDSENVKDFNGVTVRKGTVGAFIISHRIATSADASHDAKEAALNDMAEALPALQALGVFEVFQLRDTGVLALLAGRLPNKTHS